MPKRAVGLKIDEISLARLGMNPLSWITVKKERVVSGPKVFIAALRKALAGAMAKEEGELPAAVVAALAEAEGALTGPVDAPTDATKTPAPAPELAGDPVEKGKKMGDGDADCSACKPGKPCLRHKLKKEAVSFSAALAQSLRWEYFNALDRAIRTAMDDEDMKVAEKIVAIQESVDQFLSTVFAGATAISKENPTMAAKTDGTPTQNGGAAPAGGSAEEQEAMLKALPEGVQAMLRKAIATAELAQKEAAEAKAAAGTLAGELATTTETLAKERGLREEGERMAKARNMVTNVPVAVEDVAEILKALPADQHERFGKIMGTANELAKSSKLFETVGVSKAVTDAGAAIATRAEAMRKENPNLSVADSLRAAAKADQGAYEAASTQS